MDVAQFDQITTAITRGFEENGAVQNELFLADPLWAFINAKGGKKTVSDPGREIQVNLRAKKNTAGGSYAGWDLMDTTPQNTLAHAIFGWKQEYQTINIDGLAIEMSNSKRAVIDLMTDKYQEAMDSMIERMTIATYGDGTGTGGKTLLGLQALVGATGTLGGIDRSANGFWQSKVVAVNAQQSFTMYGNIINTIKGPSGNPAKSGVCDLIITTQAIYEGFEALLLPYQKIEAVGLGAAGHSGLTYKGVELTWSPNCPTGYVYFLSTKYMGLRVMSNRDFKVTDWKEPINQDGLVKQILWAGNFITSDCKRLAVATGVTP